MTSSDGDKVMRYREAINRALLTEWDPIGVNHIPEAQDEYTAYVADIHQLLVTGCPKSELVEYLWTLETQHMGLTGNRFATERFADRLLRVPVEIEKEAGI